MIQFDVYGDLVVKQSTKFFLNKKAGKVFTYTPKEIKRWQERIQSAADLENDLRIFSERF